MIRNDEEIIASLEELDSTFSQINKVLRQLKEKVEAVHDDSKVIAQNCAPWFSFFGIKQSGNTQESQKNETASDVQNSVDTQSFLKHSSPINPFFKRRIDAFEESYQQSEMTVEDAWANDSMLSELVEFDQNLLPDAFREITELKTIYFFIQRRGSVNLEEVYDSFPDVSKELMNVFLDLLIRKNFVRLYENKLFV